MQVDVWTTHSLEKLFPQTERPPRALAEISLKVARNATQDAQIVVRPGEALETATITVSDLITTDGAVIAADAVETFWQWYTYVLRNPPHSKDPSSWLRNAPDFFPDAFLEEKTVHVCANYTQPLWLKVTVPESANPGTYKGTVTIRYSTESGETGEAHVPLEIVVWSFALPEKTRLLHTEWFEPSVLARYYKIEPWSETHWEWLEKVAADMVKHHQNMILTRFLQLVHVTETADGTLTYDFARLDRWIKLFRDVGVEWIEGGHVARRGGGWESDFRWLRFDVIDTAGNPVAGYSREVMDDAAYEPYMEAFLKATYAHIQDTWGLDTFVQHIADEPLTANKGSWLNLAKKVKSWMPGVRLIDATMCEELAGELEMRVPQIQHIDAQARKDSDENLWCYVCLAPQGHAPNRFLDIASIRNRIMFWHCFSFKLQGFLHWGYAHWKSWIPSMPDCVDISPWMDATGGSIYCTDRQPLPAGDTHVVYPGKHSICSSLRWETIRKGIEDYEMLCMLEELATADGGMTDAGEKALSLIERIRNELAYDAKVYTRNDAELLAVHDEVGELIAQLMGPTQR